MLQVREPSWFGCTVEAPDGDVRCSPLEADALDVLTDATVRTDEHGFAPAELALPRPEGDDGFYAGDRLRRWQYAPYRVFDEDDRTVHEGRIVKPRAGASEITLETEGFSKSLEDDEAARLIGVDLDLSAWTEQSSARKIDLIAGTFSPESHSVEPDRTTGQPALVTGLTAPWTAADAKICEARYDAAGLPIGSLYYAWKRGANASSAPNSEQWDAELNTTDRFNVAGDATGDLQAAGPGTGTLTATAANRIFAAVRYFDTGANANDARILAIYWTCLAIFGNHGLTKRGAASATQAQGLYVSDLAPYIVGRWGPLLDVDSRSVELTSFVLPHWVQKEDTTAAAMLDSLVLFGGNTFLPLDWFVWDRRRFGMASPENHGRVWRIRLDEAAEPADAGDDATKRINGLKLTYTDGAGSQHSVGPVGSGASTETDALFDSSPTNPVNAAKGADRKIRSASMGITFEAGAILMGQTILADANRQKWSGDMQLKGHVREQGASGEEPVYMVRAFDRGVVEEDPDTSERRITSTTYELASRTNTVTIGTPPDRFPTLAARAGVVLEGLL